MGASYQSPYMGRTSGGPPPPPPPRPATAAASAVATSAPAAQYSQLPPPPVLSTPSSAALPPVDVSGTDSLARRAADHLRAHGAGTAADSDLKRKREDEGEIDDDLPPGTNYILYFTVIKCWGYYCAAPHLSLLTRPSGDKCMLRIREGLETQGVL